MKILNRPSNQSSSEPLFIQGDAMVYKFCKLTVKSLRYKLQFLSKSENVLKTSNISNLTFAWGVESTDVDKKPIALLLAEIVPSTDVNTVVHSLRILSIAVRKGWRKKRIASKLLDRAADFARQNNFKSIDIEIPLGSDFTDALDRLTASHKDWRDVPGLTLVTLSEPSNIWSFLSRLELISLHQQKKWAWTIAKLNENDRRSILASFANKNIPSWANPYAGHTHTVSYKYSRVLKLQNEIIGWLICSQVRLDTLRYTILWIDPIWEGRGGSLGMLANVISDAHFAGLDLPPINETCGAPIAKGCFGFYDERNTPMSRLCHRHLLPLASKHVKLINRSLKLK